ncbi:hypothetical protein ACFFRR_007368 [Megaselia abdita]
MGSCQKDYFSSIKSLEKLYHTEETLLKHAKDYSIFLKAQIDKFRKFIEVIQDAHSKADENPSAFIGNPIDSFSLIKRLVEDWRITKSQVENSNIFEEISSRIDSIISSEEYPTEDELTGSAEGFSRLRDVYNLDISEMASGFISGIKMADSMSWSDCFYVGKKLYEMGDYNNTQPWIREALDKFTKNHNDDQDSVEILESFTNITVAINDLDTALNTSERILKIQPNHKSAKFTKDTIEKLSSIFVRKSNPGFYVRNSYISVRDYKHYEAVCRDEITRSPSEIRDLHCKYESYRVPFLKIAPFKLEIINFDPLILMFHGVLYNSETLLLKARSLPTIGRSKVGIVKSEISNERTSHSSYVNIRDEPSLKNFVQRIEDMTQLNIDDFNSVQVANYGIGGHYAPHHDHFGKSDSYPQYHLGDRISTSMFYASEVDLGGSTAFPLLKVNVKPVKGSLLFWYNLYSSGEQDNRAMHAGCPVTKGSKWIFNVWLRFKPQFQKRKCDIEDDSWKSIRNTKH